MSSSRLNQIAGHLNSPKGLLADQVAIVTSSGQGIGAKCARLFANEGAKVVISDIDGVKANDFAEKINASSGEALAVAGDLLNDKYIKELVKKFADFGGGKIHITVNNAGFTWDAVIHKLIREAAPYFRVKDGEPRNILNYAIAKASVVGLTKTIAKEWGPAFGVRANTIAFGHIETRLTANKEAGAFVEVDGQKVALGIPEKQKAAGGPVPFQDIPLRRPGSATKAASAILAIASPLSAYITGQIICVTGGRNM
ncbi:hypothetical protein B0H67DRAFT_599200 [Lasiosphaeris hirsuta]|uniref:Uncharacterized protein n=1 Tax=Lasiosphaeris hirsuta TaxID=260670 RepID=A0AA40APC1_9PEZI|nr:hypothetical protein B0H67DRAFT_599200 [Lasiosphaeris hirsuta]